MVGIMLVEDHALFRQALAVLFDDEPDLRVVAQAGSLAEARAHLSSQSNVIRVAVVDFTLPDGDALSFIQDLRRSSPGVEVMVFTASLDPETATRAMDAGASVTLHKTADKVEILATVRRLLDDRG